MVGGGRTLRLEPCSTWVCRLWSRGASGPRSLYRLESPPFEWVLEFYIIVFWKGEKNLSSLIFFRGPGLEKITNNNI